MTSIDGTKASPPAGIQNPVPVHQVPLEPPTSLPEPDAFKPGADTWAATAFGALVGGSLSAVFASESAIGMGFGRVATPAAIVGLGALGLVAGGSVIYFSIKRSHDESQNDRLQKENGTPTLQHARELIGWFDHDRSGTIDLLDKTGSDIRDERLFIETHKSYNQLKHDWLDDDWGDAWQKPGVSAAPIWNAADAILGDDTITDVELATLMSQYDADRSGSLTTAEQDAFKDAHPFMPGPSR